MRRAVLLSMAMLLALLAMLAFSGSNCAGDATQANMILDETRNAWPGYYQRIQDLRVAEDAAIKDPANKLRDFLDTGIKEKSELIQRLDTMIEHLNQIKSDIMDNQEEAKRAWLDRLNAFKGWLSANLDALEACRQRLVELTCPVEAVPALQDQWPMLEEKFNQAAQKSAE